MPLESIVFLEANGNYVKIITVDQVEFLVSGNMKYWENQLKKRFIVRSHKSYLVNLYYVMKVGKVLHLKNTKVKLPVGRKYKNDFMEAHYKYVKNVERLY